MRPFLALLICLTLTFPAHAQDDTPACDTYTADELEAGASNLRNLNERIGDLEETLDDLTSEFSENLILRFMEWAVFADSALQRFGSEVPACGVYIEAQDAFRAVVADVYATSSQTLILSLTPAGFASDNIQALLEESITRLTISIEVWRVVFGQVE